MALGGCDMKNDIWRPITLLMLSGLILWIPQGCQNSVDTTVLVFADDAVPNFQPGISIALALATIAEENVLPEPQPTPDGKTKCTNCDGRGKVGDGRTMIECPVCNGKGYVEPKKEEPPIEAEKPKLPPLVIDLKPVEPAPPVPMEPPPAPKDYEPMGIKRILFFTAKWCGPCQSVKEEVIPWYQSGGWRVGETRDNHIQYVDVDSDPGAVSRYHVGPIPFFVLVDAQGREIARSGWDGDRMLFANLLNGQLTSEPPVTEQRPMTASERAKMRSEQRRLEREMRRAR